MSNKKIDYTKMRKGSMSGKIQVCPKCNRKGRFKVFKWSNGNISHSYDHISRIEMGMEFIKENCMIRQEKETAA